MQAARPVVLILGMHRSGTSLLARILSHLGLALGEHLLTEPVPDNQGGYWEQAEIVAVQEALLDALDRRWCGRHALSPLPTGWQEAAVTRQARARLLAILHAELDRTPGLWGFKDPRTLRFLPLWQDILAELRCTPRFILAIREPGAVARSLTRRNGLDRRFAEAIWAFNMVEALTGTAGQLTSVVDYDAWFSAPDALCRTLCDRLGLPPPAPLPAHLIDLRLRHHATAAQPCHPAFAALHAALAVAAPRPPPAETLPALVAPVHTALLPSRTPGPLTKLLNGLFERAITKNDTWSDQSSS